MTIQPNAIFIADVHYNSIRKEILPFLHRIVQNEIKVSQLFLMGDIFDFLCDDVKHFYTINNELIELIHAISFNIEVFYFEGNHDYNLQKIFPHIKVFPRKVQPQYLTLDKQKVALSHGDIYTPTGYNIYCSIIRNKYFLKFLGAININNWLSTIIIERLKKKHICHKMNNFANFKKSRISSYNCDLIIEGHFHQGYISENYINIPSFACEQKYMIYEDNQFKFIKV
jgi:UDP-2,3-diacylglucosamine hydrolase